MPSGWATHVDVGALTPAWLRANFLLGIPLGPAWDPPGGDVAMQTTLNALIVEAQGKLGIRFARQRVVTDPEPWMQLGVDYDLRGERLMFFRQADVTAHWAIPLPYANVVSIERVRLFYGDQPTVDLPAEWCSFTSKEGILRVMPALRSNVTPQWNAVDAAWYSFWFRTEIPASWSLDYTFGHGQIDDDVARWIGLSAAIQTLALVGAGSPVYGPGGAIIGGAMGAGLLSNESLSLDGISESVGYSSGQYGPYSGVIGAYQKILDDMNIWEMRALKKGWKVAVW